MKTCLLLGTIAITYGISFPVFCSDTATLTITGRVTAPTCSIDIINTKLLQRCGNTMHLVDVLNPGLLSSVRGVTTEIIPIADAPGRQIVLNRYD